MCINNNNNNRCWIRRKQCYEGKKEGEGGYLKKRGEAFSLFNFREMAAPSVPVPLVHRRRRTTLVAVVVVGVVGAAAKVGAVPSGEHCLKRVPVVVGSGATQKEREWLL